MTIDKKVEFFKIYATNVHFATNIADFEGEIITHLGIIFDIGEGKWFFPLVIEDRMNKEIRCYSKVNSRLCSEIYTYSTREDLCK